MDIIEIFKNYFNERYNPPKEIEEMEVLSANDTHYSIIIFSESNVDEKYYSIMVFKFKNHKIIKLEFAETNKIFNSIKELKIDISNIKSDILNDININS